MNLRGFGNTKGLLLSKGANNGVISKPEFDVRNDQKYAQHEYTLHFLIKIAGCLLTPFFGRISFPRKFCLLILDNFPYPVDSV